MNANSSDAALNQPQAAGQWLRAHLAASGQLSADSRAISPGDGFIAYPGLSTDGRRFIDQACDRGASAVLFDDRGFDDGASPAIAANVPSRGYVNLREQAGAVSSAYYGYPGKSMTVFAVTGTNGKTTCAHWLAAGASLKGGRAAAIGTLGVSQFGNGQLVSDAAEVTDTPGSPVGDMFAEPVLTTPDAVSLQRALADLQTDDTTCVAFEASSIGLTQHRLQGTDVNVAVFTNLSRDHLDYHGDMAAYGKAKQALFAMPGLDAAVVNTDDAAGGDMLAACGPAVTRYGYGFGGGVGSVGNTGKTSNERVDCQVRIAAIAPATDNADGMRIDFDGDAGRASVVLPVLGRFNALNAAAVCTAWLASGVNFDEAVNRLSGLEPVAGRMQSLAQAGKPLLVVDYAHTPDALESVLASLRPVADQRQGCLWVVFGCGGDRDTGKRGLMGAVAATHADRVVVTSDNPRSEDPASIVRQVADGAAGIAIDELVQQPDRKLAIESTVVRAAPNDIVLVAGKGHEAYQEIQGKRIAFSDLAVCADALRSREAV